MIDATVVRLSEVEPAHIPTVRPGTPRLTFAALAAIEPQLADLEREVRAWARTPLGDDWCANARWYGYGRFKGMGYRARLVALVGWGSRHPDPRLHTSAAYDVAYRRVYALLPDCRECACG
jgi:hypothetical protein